MRHPHLRWLVDMQLIMSTPGTAMSGDYHQPDMGLSGG